MSQSFSIVGESRCVTRVLFFFLDEFLVQVQIFTMPRAKCHAQSELDAIHSTRRLIRYLLLRSRTFQCVVQR